jgi:energy-coupling factor transport system substrate-specific component
MESVNMRIRALRGFTIFELVAIAVVSALGVATKPIVVPLVHIITGPLFIPGGAIAGGFYMLWIILGIGMVKKRGTGTLIGIIQGLLVIVTGAMGTHGIMSIISYTLPGLAADLVFVLAGKRNFNILHFMAGCMAANVTGTLISNAMFFRLPFETLLLLLSGAALSGALGGVLAWNILGAMERLNIEL